MFPAFLANELDLHFFVNDAAFHESCFVRHPLSAAISARYEESRAKTRPPYRCRVCGDVIADPDDHLTLGGLTADPSDPLFPYDYAKFHRPCLARWSDREAVRRLLEESVAAGKYRGPAIDWLIKELS
jgi:hypothetical protein